MPTQKTFSSLRHSGSLDQAWDYFMLPENAELRATIYGSEDEMKQFRRLVINLVIAVCVHIIACMLNPCSSEW